MTLPPDDQRARALHHLVPFVIGAALFMQTLDAQALANVLPVIAASMGVSPIELNLAMTAYYVGAAVFLPVSGWCADTFGARRVFQTSIVAFVACSILCGLAREPLHLAAARAVMGAATAGLMPVGRLLLIRTSERSELLKRMTYLTLPGTIGPLLGPALGGAVATYASWRWIFLINVPIGLIGLVLISLFVPNIKADERRPLDWPGAVLAGLGLATGVVLIERLSRMNPFGVIETVLAATAVACAVGYVLHTRGMTRPLLDFSLLQIPTFRAGVIGGFFFRLSVGSQPFLLAMLFQIGFGMNAFASGAMVAVTAVGTLLVRWVTPVIMRYFGFRQVLVVNCIVCAVLGVIPAFLTATTPLLVVAAVLFVRGVFRALQLTTLNVVSYVDLPTDSMSGATSLAATTQQLTQGLSTVLAAGILAATAAEGGEVTTASIAWAFIGVSGVGLVSLLSLMKLGHDDGHDVSGRAPRTASV